MEHFENAANELKYMSLSHYIQNNKNNISSVQCYLNSKLLSNIFNNIINHANQNIYDCDTFKTSIMYSIIIGFCIDSLQSYININNYYFTLNDIQLSNIVLNDHHIKYLSEDIWNLVMNNNNNINDFSIEDSNSLNIIIALIQNMIRNYVDKHLCIGELYSHINKCLST